MRRQEREMMECNKYNDD
jgi:hypothetical protein